VTLARLRTSPVLYALRHRNFRLFFAGQGISLIGSWMQTIGQAWLVMQLTHSAFLLGVVGSLQWLPVLLLSLPAGVLVDRVAKRSLLIWTQATFLVLALALGVLCLLGAVRYWHVAAIAVMFGIVNAFDVPARQAFVVEMVGGTDDMSAAVALNSSLYSGGRLIGPALGGLAIAAWGVGAAFLANAGSFLAVIAALAAMRELPAQPVASWTGMLTRIGEGVHYVSRTPVILWVLAMLAIFGLFPANYTIFIPVLAQVRLGLGASGFGLLTAANGAGAVLGGLLVAAQGSRISHAAYMYWSALLCCVFTIALSAAARAGVAAVLLFLAGGALVSFSAVANSAIQFHTPDLLRGRVMSIYSLVWNGSGPFGSLLIGGTIGAFGLSAGFLVGGGAALLGTLILRAVLLPRRTNALPAPAAAAEAADRR
jgi:MFS family permease